MNAWYPFPIPEETIERVNEEVRPLAVWERYGGPPCPLGGRLWALQGVEHWSIVFEGIVDLLSNEIETMETESQDLTQRFLIHRGNGIKLMVIDERSHSRLLTLVNQLGDLNRDLDSFLSFALKTWRHDPAVIALQQKADETVREEPAGTPLS